MLTGLVQRLGLPDSCVQPTYEDPAIWVMKEAALPENVDALDSKLESVESRSRIARVFSRGLREPSGYVLPLAYEGEEDGAWISERWTTRREHLFLVPGDSPVGYRLPLDGLVHLPASEYPHIVEKDPLVARGELPNRRGHRRAGVAKRTTTDLRCAPRSPPSRATDCSASSCRRSSGSRITSR